MEESKHMMLQELGLGGGGGCWPGMYTEMFMLYQAKQLRGNDLEVNRHRQFKIMMSRCI